MTCKEFLSHCTACGGNWVAMLESGMRECFPDKLEALRNDERYVTANGREQFLMLDAVLTECGVV